MKTVSPPKNRAKTTSPPYKWLVEWFGQTLFRECYGALAPLHRSVPTTPPALSRAELSALRRAKDTKAENMGNMHPHTRNLLDR